MSTVQMGVMCELESGHDGAHTRPKLREGPIPMLLWCPSCHTRHVDKGEFVTKPHHTHACQNCGMTWRPAIEDTVGVQFLPGFKDERMLPVKIPSPEEIEEGVLR